MPKKIICNILIVYIFISQLILIKLQGADEPDAEESTYYNTAVIEWKNKINIISNYKSYLETNGGYSENYKEEDKVYCQISLLDKQSGLYQGNIRLPQIKISDQCLNIIKDRYPNENITVSKIFRKEQFNLNTLAGITDITDIIYYQFFHINIEEESTNGNINIQQICNEKVTFYLPIYSDDTLKNKYMSVRGQNPSEDFEDLRDYDIFDPDSKFYHDICARITYNDASENIDGEDSFENYDITLHERRKYYFPGNTQLCPDGFTYLGIDKNTFSSMCEKAFIDYDTVSNYPHDKYASFEFDSEDFNSSHKDIYFTMNVLKCIKLPFTKSGFKGNYGNYIILVLIAIIIACYVILLLTGKYHLLSVLELLYNSNIKSMNYLKGASQNPLSNSNQVILYDIKSNNNLGMTHQTIVSNGQLLSNALTGSNFLYYNPNADKVSVSKKSNSNSISNNNFKKNEKEKEKKDLMSNVDEQENDYESEKGNEEKDNTNIYNDSMKDVNVLNVKNKEKSKNNDKKTKTPEKDNKEEKEEENEEDDEDYDENEESESNRSYKNKLNKKIENKDKSNPPKKSMNGGGQEEENGKKEKKRKSKNPIEISLNVKDLRDMMFKDQIPKSVNMKEEPKENENFEKKSKSKPKKKNKNNSYESNPNNNGNNNLPPNGFPFPYISPMIPPYGMPPYPYNGGQIPQNEETEKLKRELEYQKELNERRDREMRREREDMLQRERELQRQRELDLERERRLREMEMMYGNKGMGGIERFENINKKNNGVKRGSALWNDYSNDILMKEREKFFQEQDKLNKIKEELEKELKKKNEENYQIQRELDLIRGSGEKNQIEYEKLLLKKEQELKEQFEKEKKEIIDAKNREIQILKEDKEREIQRLKEDKDREIDLLKEDMNKEIKKKQKVIEKQKKEAKDLKKDLTTNNTFYTNNNPNSSTFRPNNFDPNGIKREEKLEAPQVVVSISSIFTDQELNAMDFEESCQFDKRSLCQVYLSFINRKQPLFFFFNYNMSSSGISIFQINYQSIRFIIICVDFMIYMFIYCTFFGTKSITYIYLGKFNFRRMCILGSIISPFCLIIRSVIHHFIYDPMNKKIAEIKMKCYTNFIVGKKKEELKVNEFREFWESDGNDKNKDELAKKEELADIQEIENDENLPEEEKIKRKEKYEKRRLKLLIKEVIALFQKKLLISFPIIIVAIFFEWMYVSSFCAVYKHSQLKFFLSILVCYGFANLIPFVYCLVPTIFKQDSVRDESKFSFFLSNVFQII